MATDCNARFVALDPYAGAQLALAEAYRNVATSGAVPLAVTNCLNFGSPEDPHVMWQFARGRARARRRLRGARHPGDRRQRQLLQPDRRRAILPTPVVGVLGVLDDVARRVPPGSAATATRSCCSARPATSSAAASGPTSCTGTSAAAAAVDLAAERRLAALLAAAAADGLLTGAHDLSDGGLAQALVEACLSAAAGATVVACRGRDPFVALFAESAARVLVTVPGRGGALARAGEAGCAGRAAGLDRRRGAGDRRGQL